MNKELTRAMVVEDEQEALDLLSGLLEATGMATVVAATTDPFEAVGLISMHEPDMLFLDIRMPGMSGFNILTELRTLNGSYPHVVFTTAHDEYAIKAFDYAAFDYLLKPIDPERLRETLERFTKNEKKEPMEQPADLFGNEKILMFRGVSGVTFIDTDEVVFITADGNYSIFQFITGRTETVTALLGAVEGHLGKQFFRTGRSCIINTSYLARIDIRQQQCVFMKGEREFRCEISRDKIKVLMNHMKNHIPGI
jgi:two-component system LytT family response regulator